MIIHVSDAVDRTVDQTTHTRAYSNVRAALERTQEIRFIWVEGQEAVERAFVARMRLIPCVVRAGELAAFAT
jgi:hypothetical protein